MDNTSIHRYLTQRQHPRRYAPARTPNELAQDTHAFARSYPLGRASENCTRTRLEAVFAQDAILAHCDTTLDSRSLGKRVILAGRATVLPDFQIMIAGIGSLFLDIKSKHYHSYFHLDGEVQQFVNRDALEDYQACARWYGAPAFILVHLWPDALRREWATCPARRIHAGKYDLSLEVRETLIRRYPVDDWYYLLPVRLFFEHGRLGGNPSGRAPGYYLSLHYALQGPASGVLPPRDAWIRALQYEKTIGQKEAINDY